MNYIVETGKCICKFSLKLVGMMLVAAIFVHIVNLLGTLNFNMMGRLRMEGKKLLSLKLLTPELL
jgi:hypothetical protein